MNLKEKKVPSNDFGFVMNDELIRSNDSVTGEDCGGKCFRDKNGECLIVNIKYGIIENYNIMGYYCPGHLSKFENNGE